jgi:hypothetical protein
MAKKKSSGYRPQKSSEKREKRTDENNHEFRFDIRARNGKLTRVRFLERNGEAEFHNVTGNFTEQHVRHARLLAKAGSMSAKRIALPYDADAIVHEANTPPRRKKRVTPRAVGLYDERAT